MHTDVKVVKGQFEVVRLVFKQGLGYVFEWPLNSTQKKKNNGGKKNAMHAFFLTIIIFDSDPQSTYFNQRVKNQWFHSQNKVTKQLAAKGFKPLIK